MAKVAGSSGTSRKMRPALTPEAREGQLCSLATDLAEQQLRDGTASSQVITHYLKLATTREKLERERLEKENELLKAKTEALQSQKEYNKLVEEAIKAMRSYQGQDEVYDY